MDNKKGYFKALVQKYLNGTATPEERAVVEQYYQLFEEEAGTVEFMGDNETERLESKMFQAINTGIQSPQRGFRTQVFFYGAAIAAAVTGLAFFLFFLLQPRDQSAFHPVESADKSAFTRQVPYNRFLQLPDGTTVVLHGNSRLEYEKDFNTTLREVTLTGEAFFDVKHNPGIPFVIHTGKIKTTVLGTAFNIKAWPEQKDITVSVARGKVKVENENKFVAILTEDKQVVYNLESENADQHKIHADSSIAWVQTDMTFDNMPFGNLAEHLSRRYNLDIVFQNTELKNCPITGRFSGTETILEVLNILSVTSNTTYRIESNRVIIAGEKCF